MPKPSTDSIARVGDIATTHGKLPLGRTVLIGVFGTENAPNALLRNASGHIRKVGLGDDVMGGTVSAIGGSSVVIAQGRQTRVLRLP